METNSATASVSASTSSKNVRAGVQVNAKSSPPKFIRQPSEVVDDEMENCSMKISVSPLGRLRKSTSQRSNDSNFNELNTSLFCDKCEKCSLNKENTLKAISHVRTYVDNINERLNLTYHKTGQLRKNNNEMDNSMSLEYHHAIFYSELDKLSIGSEMLNQFRYLMKSLRLFNDKFDYITKKHENFEKVAHEYKNYKMSNKIEDLTQLPEIDVNEIKSLSEQTIFKSFNLAKESFEKCMAELKTSLNGNFNMDRNTNNLMESKMLESFELNCETRNMDSNKDSYLRNELSRLIKENTSLRLELNYIYERLREENKIFEIKEDIIVKKSSSSKENASSNSTPDNKQIKKSKTLNYYSSSSASVANNYSNPIVVFKVKNDKKDEDYLIAKNYIKMLRQSEFYMI